MTSYKKAVEWWLSGGINPANCVAAYQAKGAANYEASKINLANPGTYNLAEIGGGSVNWANSTGWGGFVSLTRCLNTGVTPALNLTWSMFVRFSDYSTSNYEVLAGYYNAKKSGFLFGPHYDNDMVSFHGNDDYTQIANNPPRIAYGVYGFAGRIPYRNGSAEANTFGTYAGNSPLTIYIGARCLASGVGNYFSGNIQAVVVYNTTLTANQVAALSTAMAGI